MEFGINLEISMMTTYHRIDFPKGECGARQTPLERGLVYLPLGTYYTSCRPAARISVGLLTRVTASGVTHVDSMDR
jgi:hypothetical protein